MSEEKVGYGKTYVSFSGADFIPYLNGQIIGELMSIDYTEGLDYNRDNFYPINGIIKVCLFDRASFRNALQVGGKNEFYLFAKSEYGQSLRIDFVNIKFMERKGGMNVDQIVMEEGYTFKCGDLVFQSGFCDPTYTENDVIEFDLKKEEANDERSEEV